MLQRAPQVAQSPCNPPASTRLHPDSCPKHAYPIPVGLPGRKYESPFSANIYVMTMSSSFRQVKCRKSHNRPLFGSKNLPESGGVFNLLCCNLTPPGVMEAWGGEVPGKSLKVPDAGNQTVQIYLKKVSHLSTSLGSHRILAAPITSPQALPDRHSFFASILRPITGP